MEKISLTPRALVTRMVDKSGLSRFDVSMKMGKSKTFISNYATTGRIPSAALLAEVARACGYEVHIIGHGEDITVEVADD